MGRLTRPAMSQMGQSHRSLHLKSSLSASRRCGRFLSTGQGFSTETALRLTVQTEKKLNEWTSLAVAIEDEKMAEVTARAMGWVPLESEDGTTIWVRSEDIGLDDSPYCNTAVEVVRSYTH